MLDWDNPSGEVETTSADALIHAAAEAGVTIWWVLKAHAHADHLTAAPYIKAKTGAPIGIGEHIREVQKIFRPVFDTHDFKPEGGDFDRLFKNGEIFALGAFPVEMLHLTGHTLADVVYRLGNDIFVGDTLFMHDFGTERVDFPGGNAHQFWKSIQRLLALPRKTRIWVCHDFNAPGRVRFNWQSTVADQRANNPHVKDGKTEVEFVAFCQARDSTLAAPTLLLPSIQVNIRAGRIPEAEASGVGYLKLPVKAKAAGTAVAIPAE